VSGIRVPQGGEIWPIRDHTQFRCHLAHPDGRQLAEWPPKVPPPGLGDLIDLPSGQYRVIRRRWDLSQPGLIGLEAVADDQPE
jgi:hypothetical protein